MASKTAARALTVTTAHRREINKALDAALGARNTNNPDERAAFTQAVIDILQPIDARFRQHHEKAKKAAKRAAKVKR